MKKKIGMAAVICMLLCLILVCQKAGEYLRRGIHEGRETAGAVSRNEDLVVLDAGHGGEDPGKVGLNGAEEKDINLNIALLVKEYLEEAEVEVVMTRTEDERLADTQAGDLKERVSLMNGQNPILAVSIHQNSYHEQEVRGAQVFYYTDSAEGEEAAECLRRALAELDPDNTKQIKANNTYYLLKNTYFADNSVNGQRGRARKSKLSDNPNKCRSIPAHAIITPLSVHNLIGGAEKISPVFLAFSSNILRTL